MISWRLYAGLTAFALFGALVFAVVYFSGQAQRFERKAREAEQQATNNANAVQAVDRFHETTTIIKERADEGVQVIQAAPGASDPVPEGVLSGWASGIGRLRDGPAELQDPPT